jgi:hypothetical protein
MVNQSLSELPDKLMQLQDTLGKGMMRAMLKPPDVEHLEPMLVRIAASAGALPTLMTMDAGY